MKSRFHTFIKGVASILNIFPTATELKLHRLEDLTPEDGFKKDWKNLENDWETLGKDMCKGMENLSNGKV